MTDTKELLIVLITCDAGEAQSLAQNLVQQGLVACVNEIPGIRSTYLWEGKVQSDNESLLLAKTTQAAYPALEKQIRHLHSYTLPEILALSPFCGLAEYEQWVVQSVTEAR
ncbi:MAG: divalent-cation tolerance protein CutA [Pseudomonadota bacterium]